MTIALLRNANDEELYGRKAVALSKAMGAGMKVPHGVAIGHDSDLSTDVANAALDHLDVRSAGDVTSVYGSPSMARYAVRSSAIGEDGDVASFAGQHLTMLNVSRAKFWEALQRVKASATSDAALVYRERMSIAGPPKMAIVVQEFVPAVVSGVCFTQDPVSGADELVIEAARGLGEAVVGGLVVPDRFRMSKTGKLMRFEAGNLDKAIVPAAEGVKEVPVARTDAPCLDAGELFQLWSMARRMREIFAHPMLDIEWAFDSQSASPYVLQIRNGRSA